MKSKHNMKSKITFFLFGLLTVMSFISEALAQQGSVDTNEILYHYTGVTLRDSKWGRLAELQGALSENLTACGQPAVSADGRFGSKSQEGLMRLLACPPFADFKLPTNSPLYGTIHTGLWQMLLPNISLPSVHERAFVLSLTHEGTDYDTVEWNYGTSDNKSALTWGPYGATAGWGNEIRGIFKKIEQENPSMLNTVFAEEFTKVSELMEKDQSSGYQVLKPVWNNPSRRLIWKTKFKELSAEKVARDSYEWYAFQSNEWLKPGFKRLYGLIPDAQTKATEIDYAFFLDLAMHMSITQQRVEVAKEAIARKERKLGHALNPSERRQVISLTMIPSAQRQDRLGRNVVYYVDGVGIEGLSAEEKTAWRNRSNLRASNCGLSDSRSYFPEFLK